MAVSLERILQAARQTLITGKREPHCYSAHVPGQGYVNDGTDPTTRADYLRQLDRDVTCEIDNLGYAPAYAEPGYSTPTRGIVFANWNKFPRDFDSILERAGYAIEWSDEWSFCDDCGHAFRTSGNSYHWTPAYAEIDGSYVCLACVDYDDLIERSLNNANRCLTVDQAEHVDLADHGFTLHTDNLESGWHPGQTDNPRELAKTVPAGHDFLFVQTEQSQFYVRFALYIRPESE